LFATIKMSEIEAKVPVELVHELPESFTRRVGKRRRPIWLVKVKEVHRKIPCAHGCADACSHNDMVIFEKIHITSSGKEVEIGQNSHGHYYVKSVVARPSVEALKPLTIKTSSRVYFPPGEEERLARMDEEFKRRKAERESATTPSGFVVRTSWPVGICDPMFSTAGPYGVLQMPNPTTFGVWGVHLPGNLRY